MGYSHFAVKGNNIKVSDRLVLYHLILMASNGLDIHDIANFNCFSAIL